MNFYIFLPKLRTESIETSPNHHLSYVIKSPLIRISWFPKDKSITFGKVKFLFNRNLRFRLNRSERPNYDGWVWSFDLPFIHVIRFSNDEFLPKCFGCWKDIQESMGFVNAADFVLSTKNKLRKERVRVLCWKCVERGLHHAWQPPDTVLKPKA